MHGHNSPAPPSQAKPVPTRDAQSLFPFGTILLYASAMTHLADLIAGQGADDATVRRRHVFYLSGFDPRGAPHYHKLYRDEAAKQAAVNGLEITVGPRRKTGETETQWRLDAGAVATDYSFLHYDDIVRARWARTNWAVLREIARYAVLMQRRGMFAKVLLASWPTFIAMAYPAFLLILALVASALAAWGAAALTGSLAGLAAAPIMFFALLQLRPWLESRGNALWIARILSFMCDQGAGRVPELDARLDDWAWRVAAVVASGEADEVLIAAHSVGTQLAVSLAARVVGLCSVKTFRLSLLTLGHTIPLEAMQPAAAAYRAELAVLAATPELDWIDVSAPVDSACFPLCDPLAASGLAQPDPRNPKPKLVSARFAKLFSPEGYRAVKKEFRRAHFQYLMASEYAGDYDFFLITAGDRTLGRRFARTKSAVYTRYRLGRP